MWPAWHLEPHVWPLASQQSTSSMCAFTCAYRVAELKNAYGNDGPQPSSQSQQQQQQSQQVERSSSGAPSSSGQAAAGPAAVKFPYTPLDPGLRDSQLFSYFKARRYCVQMHHRAHDMQFLNCFAYDHYCTAVQQWHQGPSRGVPVVLSAEGPVICGTSTLRRSTVPLNSLAACTPLCTSIAATLFAERRYRGSRGSQ